jgi:hypothetical protein
VLLELNTQLAASLFTKIGKLEADLDSQVGKQLCRKIGEMGAELALSMSSFARTTALQLADEFTSEALKPTIVLSPCTSSESSAKSTQIFYAWDAPSPPDSTENIFATEFERHAVWRQTACSQRIMRDEFVTPDECSSLVGMTVVAMAGSYHRGGHCRCVTIDNKQGARE